MTLRPGFDQIQGACAGLPAPAADLGDVNGATSGPMRKWNYLQQSTNGSICDKVTLQSPGWRRGKGRPVTRQVWCSNSDTQAWADWWHLLIDTYWSLDRRATNADL